MSRDESTAAQDRCDKCGAPASKWDEIDCIESGNRRHSLDARSAATPCDCADGFLYDPRVPGNVVECPRCTPSAASVDYRERPRNNKKSRLRKRLAKKIARRKERRG